MRNSQMTFVNNVFFTKAQALYWSLKSPKYNQRRYPKFGPYPYRIVDEPYLLALGNSCKNTMWRDVWYDYLWSRINNMLKYFLLVAWENGLVFIIH